MNYFCLSGSVLLNSDPEKVSQIFEESYSTHSTSLKKTDADVKEDELPVEINFALTVGYQAVH